MYDTEGSEHHIHILDGLLDYQQSHEHLSLKEKGIILV